MQTARALVDASSAGYFVDELDDLLHVRTKDCLRHLVEQCLLARQEIRGRYLVCSADAAKRRAQKAAREVLFDQPRTSAGRPVSKEVKATIILFMGLLDEKQRRLFAGLESIKVGRGGDAVIAQLLGLDPATVAKGRHALASEETDSSRVRRPGAGRPPVEKKRRRSSRVSRNS